MNQLEMIYKLNERYASTNMANRGAVMTNLTNFRYDGERDMAEYVSEFESMLNKLAVTRILISNDMQMAILLVSLSSEESLPGTISKVNRMDTDIATWQYVSGRLIEEMRSLRLVERSEHKATKAIATSSSKCKTESIKL